MKILHIGEYVKGGVGTYVNDVVSYQRQQQHEVYLMISDYNSANEFDIESDKLIRYNYRRKLSYFPKAMLLISKKIKEIDPDIIHIHSSFAGMFVRLPLLLKKNHLRAKVIYCAHGWSFLMDTSDSKKKIYSFIEKYLSKATDKIINISAIEQRAATSIGISNEKNILIYNGVREREIYNNNKFTVDSSKINILFLGRFDKAKGIDILFEVIKNIKREDLQFYFIGDSIGGENNTIPKNLKQSHFLGWIDNSEIDFYISKIDCLIIPSRSEGFGLVAIEGMRNSKPAIVSNRGALPELIKHGFNGYVFDLNQISSLEKILLLLSKEQLSKIGNNGRELYSEKFTSKKMNENLLGVYWDTLKNGNGNSGMATVEWQHF